MEKVVSIGGSREPRIPLLLQKQLAAQAVAILDAHFTRPTAEEKAEILQNAIRQVAATQLFP